MHPQPPRPGTLDYERPIPRRPVSRPAGVALLAGVASLALTVFIAGRLFLPTFVIVLLAMFGVATVALGVVARTRIRRDHQRGRWMATSGIVISLIATCLVLPVLCLLANAMEHHVGVKLCASNLRQIGQAVRLYAINNDPDFSYPPNLEGVAASAALPPSGFVCTMDEVSSAAPPPFVLGQNLSYAYLGDGMTDEAGPSVVLGYCYAHLEETEGTMVLFADGSVRYEQKDDLPPEVQAAK